MSTTAESQGRDGDNTGKPARPLSCLVVDDSTADLNHLSSCLEQLGHRTTSTQDPRTVESELDRQGYDVLFLDVVMPERNGYAVLRSIKGRADWVRTIMVSSKGDDRDLNWAYLQGADGYLVKPYGIDELSTVLERIDS